MQERMACVRKMVDYIEARIGDTPSLYDIAREVGYSPYHCSTMFHRVSGMTIRDYIAARRLALVAAALRNARGPIAQIALEFGFSSQTALTRAFKNAYGISPSKYRRKPIPIPQQIRLNIPFEINEKGEMSMSEFKTLDVRTEYIPAHKYLGAYKRTDTKNGLIWPGHDCDLLCGIIESMPNTDRIIGSFTAGWDNSTGSQSYFFGGGIDAEAKDIEIPDGLELRGEFPGSYYLVFSHPPFKYPEENAEAMSRVEELAWSYDPTPLGFEWNEKECQCYQRHYPEVLGYQVLRPVKKIKQNI